MRMVSAAGPGGGEADLQQQLVSTGLGAALPGEGSWALPGAAWGQHAPSFPPRHRERNCRRQLLQQEDHKQPPRCTVLLFARRLLPRVAPAPQTLQSSTPSWASPANAVPHAGMTHWVASRFASHPIPPSSSVSEHRQSSTARAPSLRGQAGSTR